MFYNTEYTNCGSVSVLIILDHTAEILPTRQKISHISFNQIMYQGTEKIHISM